MATVHLRFLQDGSLLQSVSEDPEEARYFAPLPAGVTDTIEVDEDSNQDLIRDLRAGRGTYRYEAGALFRDGEPVAVNPPGKHETARQRAKQIFARIDDDAAWDSASQAQRLEALRHLLRFVVRVMARRGSLDSEFRGSNGG